MWGIIEKDYILWRILLWHWLNVLNVAEKMFLIVLKCVLIADMV